MPEQALWFLCGKNRWIKKDLNKEGRRWEPWDGLQSTGGRMSFHRKREGVRGKEGQENPAVDTCRSLKGNCRRSDLLGCISL